MIECNESDTSFDAVSDYERRAAGIPLWTKWRKREFLAGGETGVELCAGFGEFGWVGYCDFYRAGCAACYY